MMNYDPQGRILAARAAAHDAALQESAKELAQERAAAHPPFDDEESRLLAEEADLLLNEDRRLEMIRKLKEEKEESERRQRRPHSD
ncbi:MAG TPA: hypothetical protein VIK11_00425 [Tepidiformaceae bacterium]